MIRATLLAMVLLVSAAHPAVAADAGWFESGDGSLRADLTLLNDADVIRLPVSQWPMPRAAVSYALAHAKEHFATNAAVQTALARVRARVAGGRPSWILEGSLTGGNPGLLRDFDTLGREEGELGARADFAGERTSSLINVTAVTSPIDGKRLRLDGSHATLRLGNWLVSANTLERWWGPGHESSLILSNNARPMPGVMVERAAAMPFETPWLSWLGPWRFSLGFSRMEDERQDIDAPLFMASRVVVMPFKDIEFGVSRTAQFCGKQLKCDLDSFGNLLAGNDNLGIDATAENEPGNQMAGFDIRWSSPIGNGPYAIYSQMIGEDESSYMPVKFLAQFGAEVWKPLSDGAFMQAFAEYANTTCSGTSASDPYYNCAYTQGRFNIEGYRFRGRVIGHTTDSDAESYVLGATYTAANGAFWTAKLMGARLNHDGFDDRNTVSAGPQDYAAIELGWRATLLGGQIAADVGVETLESEDSARKATAFGFVSWRREIRR